MGTKKLFYFVLAAVFVMAVSACASTGETPDATQIFQSAEQTLQAEMAATEAAKPVEEEPVAEEPVAEEPTVEVVEEPVEEVTPEDMGTPMLSVSQATNCRVGPGDEYEQVASLDTDVKVKITGWDGYGYFYTIENPNGGDDCWVWAEYATIEGDTSDLQLVKTPPTPEPDVSWAGTWLMKIDGKTYNVVMSQDSKIVYGVFKKDGVEYKFNGVVNGDNTQVDGKYLYEDDNGDEKEGRFRFIMIEGTFNQFQGTANPNTGKAWEWCGGRSGAGLPGTCTP